MLARSMADGTTRRSYGRPALFIILLSAQILGLTAGMTPARAPLSVAPSLPALQAFHAGRWDEAIAAAKTLIGRQPEAVAAYKILVAAAQRKNDLPATRLYLETLQKRQPNNPILLYALALCDLESKQYAPARDGFGRALRLSPHIAEPFIAFVDVCQAMGDPNTAVQFFTDYTRTHPHLANGYLGLGYAYSLKSQFDPAWKNLEKALRLDPKNLPALRKRSLVAFDMNRHEEFIRLCRRITPLAERLDYEALYKNYGNLGLALSITQRSEPAMAAYAKALALARAAGDKKCQTQYAYEIGRLYGKGDDPEKAIEYLAAALARSEETGDPYYKSWILLRRGEIYFKLGQWEHADADYRQALALHKERNDKEGICYGYKNLGDLQLPFGEYGAAIAWFKQAIELIEKNHWLPNRDRLRQMIWSEMGVAFQMRGDYENALHYYSKAMSLAESLGDKENQQVNLGYIGALHLKMGRREQGRQELSEALRLADQFGQTEFAGFWRISLGNAHLKEDEPDKAESRFQEALDRGRWLKYPRLVREAIKGLGAVMEAKGDYPAALNLYRQAIEMVEKERDRLALEKEKAGFLSDRTEVYERIIQLLVRLHEQDPGGNYAAMAFHYCERGKAQAFLQKLPQGQFLKHLKEVSPAYAEWAAGYQQRLDQNYRQLIKKRAEWREAYLRELSAHGLYESEPKSAPAASAESRKDEIDRLESDIDRLEKEQIQFLKKIKSQFPALVRLYEPEILDADRIQRLLKGSEALIEYHVQEDKSFAFVVRPGDVQVVELPMGRAQGTALRDMLQSMVLEIKESGPPSLRASYSELYSGLRRLYSQVFQPLERYLKADSQIIIVPDDALSYVPFGMLVTEDREQRPRFLIERYSIAYAYSASLLNPVFWMERKSSAPPRLDLLAIGNPDLGIEKPSRAHWFKKIMPATASPATAATTGEEPPMPLPYAESEVKAIGRFFKQSEVLTGRAATEAAFKTKAPQARVIHLATHNRLDTETLWHSKIELARQNGEDGFLHTYEIFPLDLNADLVVLSACDTGLGQFKRGEGLMGMSRAFLYAGAPSLVASLWPVADEVTSALMKNFYSHMADGLNKSQALQQAQVDLIRGGHIHPFYWAPFILIGNTDPIKAHKPFPIGPWVLIPLTALLFGVSIAAGRKLVARRRRRL